VTATIFGCSGFLGRYLAQSLGAIGSQLVLPYRSDDLDVQHLRTMGDLGQVVMLGEFDARSDEAVARAISQSNVVINLIGADRETWNYSYEDVHVGITGRCLPCVRGSCPGGEGRGSSLSVLLIRIPGRAGGRPAC
jgi:NADH dehydrogenase (ubiquinone) 1 alpha subcomplex subunit 9